LDKSRATRVPQGGSEKIRLLAMAVLLVVLVVVYFATRNKGGGTDQAVPMDTRFDPIETSTENAPPVPKVDPARLAEVRDATEQERVIIEAAPLQHLLEEASAAVPGDFRRLGARRLTDELYEQVLADPARFRGQPFVTKGLFAWSAPTPADMVYSGPSGDLAGTLPVFRGLFTDERGRQYTFTVLDDPAAMEPGQVVRLAGFFFKAQAVFAPGDDSEVIDPTLHFVGERLVRSYLAMEPVEEISLPLLESTVRDYEIHEKMDLPEEPLYHVLSYVKNVDADELSARAQDTTAAALRIHPNRYRGRPVRVLGTFHKMWVRELGDHGENPLEIPSVYHGLLVHNGPTFTYFISLDPKPDWVTENPHTNVIAEGIFLKVYLYQAQNGQAVVCPLLVVKRFLPYVVDSSSIHLVLMVGVLGIAGVMLLWFGVSALRDRSTDQEFRRRYFARKKKALARQLGAAAGDPGTPGDAPE